MREREISTQQELDAALAGSAMQKHEKPWKVAEGRSVLWIDPIAAIIGGLLALTGLYGTVIQARCGIRSSLAVRPDVHAVARAAGSSGKAFDTHGRSC